MSDKHPDGNPYGYRVRGERLAELMSEYVKYREPDGSIPEPFLSIVSIIAELQAYRSNRSEGEPK